MDVLSALTPQEILERDKIPRVWKPAYVWPAENDGLVRVVEGHDNPHVAEHRRHREWLRAMGRDPGPYVNHVVSAITIEEFHHEHFSMVSSYQGLSPMQAEFLELIPEQLNVSNRSSAEIHLDDGSNSEYSDNAAETPRGSSKNIDSLAINIPPLDGFLNASVYTATSPQSPQRPASATSVEFNPVSALESMTPNWSATPYSPQTTQEQFWLTDFNSRLRALEPTTATTTFGPEDESVCVLALIKRLNDLEMTSGPVFPTSAKSEIPIHLINQSETESLAIDVSSPADVSSHLDQNTLETLSSAVYANPSSSKTDNEYLYPFNVNHSDEAKVLDTQENLDLDMITNKSVHMIAGQDVDLVFDGSQISEFDTPMMGTATVFAPIVTTAAIFAKDDSPRPSKAKTAVELIVDEQDSSVEEQAPSIDTFVATLNELNLIVSKPTGRVNQPAPIVVKRAPSIDKLAQSFHRCISSVEQRASTADKRAFTFDKCISDIEERASVSPVSAWRRSTIRLKEMGMKILKPDFQEQLLVTVEDVAKSNQVKVASKSIEPADNNGKLLPLPPKDSPVMPPKLAHVSVSPISLGPGEQSLLYSRLEFMVCETANYFLVEQYLEGRIDQQTINRVVNGWASKNLPQVPEFRFDQATQHDLINSNRRTMEFTGKCSANPVQLVTNLRAWKSVIQDMNHRTFSIRDSAIRKMMYEIGEVLEMLNGSIKTLQAFDEVRTNVHRYMFTASSSPGSPLIL